METVGGSAIGPLALASLATGRLMGAGPLWGLFRPYWVISSLVMTVFAAAVLLLHVPRTSETADLARTADAATLRGLGAISSTRASGWSCCSGSRC